MTTTTNWERRFAEEMQAWFTPIVETDGQLERVLALLHATGWHVDALAMGNQQALAAQFGQIAAACRSLFDALVSPPAKLETFLLEVGPKVAAAVQTIPRLANALPADLPTAASELPADLLNWLTIQWLRRHHPIVYTGLRVIGVICNAPQAEESFGGAVYRTKNAVPRFDQKGLVRVLREPHLVLKEAFWGSGITDADGAFAIAIELWSLAEVIGLTSFARIIAPNESFDPDAPVIVIDPDTVRLSKTIQLTDETSSEFGVTIKAIAPAAGGPGALLTPFGELTGDFDLGVARLQLRGTGRVNPIQIDSAGVRQVDSAQLPMTLEFSLARGDATSPFVVIGEPGGFQLSIETLAILGGIQLAPGKARAFIGTDVRRFRLVLSVAEADGFLSTFLPPDGISAEASVVIEWSTDGGIAFRGGAGLETTLPIHKDLLGVLKIDSVYLALLVKEDKEKKSSAIQAVTATTVKVQLGPVSAIVERFGLQATLSFPEKGGNLGVANLGIGFKPPNGIGLVIKAQVVTGGGYLYFDFEKEQYAGVLQLEIAQKFSLTAVGLLTTKMPDGKPGFSLLVIISVRFDPGIQLGYGFSLNGLGGLLGVNRTVTTEVLRDGLRRGALGSILFPQNVVENAPQIISNLSAIFPPAQDRFLFGPMAIIGWGGSPPILSMEIGIILELPDPVRLIILGRLSVTLPGKSDESSQAGGSGTGGGEKKQDTPKIKLQLDSLGIIDFGSGDISLDAYLYDSTIGPFTITGGMALRASFGAKPMFLLSVGGYHPAFQVPDGFPSVERVAIGLSKKESGFEFRLQLSAYFALTSNTVQFGAHLDLYVYIAGFVEIIGLLGFDALIQFKPFGVIASFEAMVSVKVSGLTLMAVGLQVNLEGPSPWHVWGKAHFEILGFKQSAEFSAVIGRAEPPHLPPPTDVELELFKELQKLSNWSSQLPAGENPLVTFRDSIPPKDPAATPPKKKVLIHPLAELHINQRLVPLNADPITRYGTTTPTGATTFALEVTEKEKTPSTSALTVSDLSDWFALAQFYVMSDAQKLSAPSFEEKDSGRRVKAEDGFTCGEPVKRDIAAAQLSSDPKDAQTPSKLDAATYLDQVAHLGAAGQSPMRAAGSAKYGDPTWWDQGITLVKAGYRVVGEEDDSTAPKARATRRAGTPSPSNLFEEAMDDMAAIAEPVMSYSAALARTVQARQRAPRRRTWVVPKIGATRGGR